ncbi:MAG: oligosaccharide flippase family protein [Cyclobacteriaceae bacterium]|nr:oligosaccharide flippase family protein [Cyclobacteriaceae bacterium]
MIVLARILNPYDFGLVAITEVLIALIGVIGTAGISDFLLAYQKENEDEIFKASFWLNFLLSVIILVGFLVCLPYWAGYQHDARIVDLGWFVGGYFFASQVQSVPKTMLSRRLEFRTLVQIQNPFLIFIPVGKIICAYAGFGVYSLVIPTLLFSFVQCLLFFKYANFNPGWHLYIGRWGEIFSFSKNMVGTMLLARVASEGDKVILAGVLGLEQLGIYNMAFQMAQLYPNTVLGVTNNILSATLPKFASNFVLLRAKYYSFLQVLAFVSVPIQVILAIAAGPIIELMYGAKWGAAILPFQILSLFAIVRTLASSSGAVLNTIGKPHVAFYIVLAYTPLHLLVSYGGSQFGIIGLSIGIVMLKFAFLPVEIYTILKSMGSSIKEWFDCLKEVLIQNVLTIVACIALILVFGFGTLQPLWQLGVFSVSYLLVLYGISRILYVPFLKRLSIKLSSLDKKYALIFNAVYRIKL